MYMPQLIQAGKVYKAVPPLYSIPVGKHEQYFTANIDFVKYIQKLFTQKNEFKHLNNKNTLTSKEETVFFMRNQDYVYWLESISATFAVEPKLLEFALYEYYNKTSISKLKKELTKQFRFMSVEEKGKSLVYSGIIGDSNILTFNDMLLKECKPILDILDKNTELYYLLNISLL